MPPSEKDIYEHKVNVFVERVALQVERSSSEKWKMLGRLDGLMSRVRLMQACCPQKSEEGQVGSSLGI